MTIEQKYEQLMSISYIACNNAMIDLSKTVIDVDTTQTSLDQYKKQNLKVIRELIGFYGSLKDMDDTKIIERLLNTLTLER